MIDPLANCLGPLLRRGLGHLPSRLVRILGNGGLSQNVANLDQKIQKSHVHQNVIILIVISNAAMQH